VILHKNYLADVLLLLNKNNNFPPRKISP